MDKKNTTEVGPKSRARPSKAPRSGWAPRCHGPTGRVCRASMRRSRPKACPTGATDGATDGLRDVFWRRYIVVELYIMYMEDIYLCIYLSIWDIIYIYLGYIYTHMGHMGYIYIYTWISCNDLSFFRTLESWALFQVRELL